MIIIIIIIDNVNSNIIIVMDHILAIVDVWLIVSLINSYISINATVIVVVSRLSINRFVLQLLLSYWLKMKNQPSSMPYLFIIGKFNES